MAGLWLLSALGLIGAGAWVLAGAPARAASLAGLVTLIGSVFFLTGGRGEPGAPIAHRLAELAARSPEMLSATERLALLQSIVKDRPADPEAQRFLGDEYARAGRWFEAVGAYRSASVAAPSVRNLSAFARASVALNDGAVTPPAVSALEAVLQQQADDVDARWLLGLAREQAGDRAQAADMWVELFATQDASDPGVARRLDASVEILSRPRTGPVAAEVGDGDREGEEGEPVAPDFSMMVDRVSARITAEPDRIEHVLTLTRLLAFIGDQAGARDALATAAERFADSPGHLALIDAARRRAGPADRVSAGGVVPGIADSPDARQTRE